MEAVMLVQIKLGTGERMFAEMQEFASFGIEVQRYICRSLDIAFGRNVSPADWVGDNREGRDVCAQKQAYGLLRGIADAIPQGDGFVDAEAFLLPLIAVTTFDVTRGPIASFDEYRFLYERLLGPEIRPWLASAFLAAASSPYIPSEIRQGLVHSAHSALTDRWSSAEPVFRPARLAEQEVSAA
jgi:hypothetical protein